MIPPLGARKSVRPRQLLNRKQIELLAQQTMVALLRLFELIKVVVESFFEKNEVPVNPLQFAILFISQPISARNVKQFECLILPVDGICGPRQKS